MDEYFSDTTQWNFIKVGTLPAPLFPAPYPWVPEACRAIFQLESKWWPGGVIYDFLDFIVKACWRTFLGQDSMEIYQSWHIASTICIPDAR